MAERLVAAGPFQDHSRRLPMLPLLVDLTWSTRIPGARMGLLEAHGLAPLPTRPRLGNARLALEAKLRQRYGALARSQLRERPVLRAFESHFKPFGKTYHVLQQLESVAVKGRSIPSRSCAVTALLMAELKHGLVSAGHALSRLEPPLRLAPALGGERYTTLGRPDRASHSAARIVLSAMESEPRTKRWG